MALSEKEIEEALESSEPNEPAQIPGVVGTTGRHSLKRTRDEREHLILMARLLAQELPFDQICLFFEKNPYDLSEARCRRLRSKVRARWAEEDKERAPWRKAASERRMLEEIRGAVKAGQFSAVAQLEKTLMEVQGTSAELAGLGSGGDGGKLGTAMINMLSELSIDQQKFRLLVETEKVRYMMELRNPSDDGKSLPESTDAVVVGAAPRDAVLATKKVG